MQSSPCVCTYWALCTALHQPCVEPSSCTYGPYIGSLIMHMLGRFAGSYALVRHFNGKVVSMDAETVDGLQVLSSGKLLAF